MKIKQKDYFSMFLHYYADSEHRSIQKFFLTLKSIFLVGYVFQMLGKYEINTLNNLTITIFSYDKC